MAPDLVADAVPDDGRDHDDHQHGRQVGVAQAGGDPTEDGQRLTGQDEADEQRVLGEDDEADDGVHDPGGGAEDLLDEGVHRPSIRHTPVSHLSGAAGPRGPVSGVPRRSRAAPGRTRRPSPR